jgi:hypothetical protein
MAIQTRYAGDAFGINNFDPSTTAAGSIISTGLTKAPVALKILLGNSQNFGTNEMVTGGAVETILRNIAIDSTVVLYQVEATGGQLSVLLEASGAGSNDGGHGASTYSGATVAAAIQSRLQALGANVGIAGNVYMGAGVTVTSAGFKLA